MGTYPLALPIPFPTIVRLESLDVQGRKLPAEVRACTSSRPSKLDGNVLLHLTMMVLRSLHDVVLRGDVPTLI